MSEEPAAHDPVELTRRAYAAVNSGDFDAIMAFFGPKSIWDVSRMGLGSYRGLAAIRRFLEDWIGSFDRYQVEVEQARDLGNGVVHLVASIDARSAGSISHVRLRYAPVLVWVDGVAMRVTHYPDVDEARAAAEGLAESRG
jgi:ketosteroid isomerase-like protein